MASDDEYWANQYNIGTGENIFPEYRPEIKAAFCKKLEKKIRDEQEESGSYARMRDEYFTSIASKDPHQDSEVRETIEKLSKAQGAEIALLSRLHSQVCETQNYRRTIGGGRIR